MAASRLGDASVGVSRCAALATVLCLLSAFSAAAGQVAKPVLSPASSTFSSRISVTITSSTSGAQILWTTDGSEPTLRSQVYHNPLQLDRTTTLKAKAFYKGMVDSLTATGTYTLKMDRVAAPVFTPGSTAFPDRVTVKITTATSGAQILWTTDGSEPTLRSQVYHNPLQLDRTTILKAKAFYKGMDDSATTSGTYTLKMKKVATPVLSPASATFGSNTKVTVTCATPGAQMYYTLNGAEPHFRTAQIYNSRFPLTLSEPGTLKVKAFYVGMEDSETAVGTYRQEKPRVAKPVISPKEGTFDSSIQVTVTCDTPGATIRYTTDETQPGPSAKIYSGPLKLTETVRILLVRAYKDGMIESYNTAGGPYHKKKR